MKTKLNIILLFLALFACSVKYPGSRFIGFWEGPHPEDQNKKFYIHFKLENDSIKAKGYWTNHRFYQESFKVDSVEINATALSFRIPAWNCKYQGILSNKNNIVGGFACMNEPFDKVNLAKNNEARNYLIDAKPGANEKGITYNYSVPETANDKVKAKPYISSGDSMFVHSLIPEIIAGEYGRINSFLIYKNNHLICEEYFYGFTKDDAHPIESCTKSVTSLLIGIAKDKGYIKEVHQTIGQVFPEYSHLKQKEYNQITIEDLLTMTAGFEPDNDNMFRSEDRIAFALKRDVIAIPGEKFQYDGGNTEILGGILKNSTGEFADKFAEKYLFKPLGITNYNWEINKQNRYPSMAGALHLCPRDMGKLGLLIFNDGKFSGRQVISEDWIKESTTVKTKIHIPGDDYSYQWWNLNLKSGERTYECIWANGWGSQFIYIFPQLNTVIVTTGYNYAGDSWAITKGICKYLELLDSNVTN